MTRSTGAGGGHGDKDKGSIFVGEIGRKPGDLPGFSRSITRADIEKCNPEEYLFISLDTKPFFSYPLRSCLSRYFLEIISMSTYFPSGKGLEQQRQWLIVDADGKTVGRLASEVAYILMGKHKPTYTPFLDTGDHVIVINAAKIVFKGNKTEAKFYRHHTGWPGGLKEISAQKLLAKNPVRLVELAIKGMLPKTKMGRAMSSKLKVYAGAEHPHGAQKPVPLAVEAK
jgi:large subunit ribosomal protein L13